MSVLKMLDDKFSEFGNLNTVYDSDEHGIPLLPEFRGGIPRRFIDFSMLGRARDHNTLGEESTGVHFFLDDYRFESVWRWVKRGLDKVRKTNLAISPDFSVYDHFPLPVQMYNVFRSRWVGRYWADNGVDVIPNVTWAGVETLSWVFKSLPKRTTIAVGTKGAIGSAAKKEYFNFAYGQMLDILEPTNVILVGRVPAGLPQVGYKLHTYTTYREGYYLVDGE